MPGDWVVYFFLAFLSGSKIILYYRLEYQRMQVNGKNHSGGSWNKLWGGDMNIIVLHGSPRKGGDSDMLAETFLAETLLHRDCEVRHFYLNEMSIKPCQGCLECGRDEKHRCIQEDDMQQIYEAFGKAEIVVWATPMYWGYMTAQMKLALDRMEALVMADGWRDKIFAVFLTYHYHVASTVNFFERVCPFFETELHIITCRTMIELTGQEIPVQDMPDELEEVRILAKKLANN